MIGTKVIAPFKPLPWQIEPWRCKSLVMLLTGSAGGGKSRLAAEKLHAYCKKYPGSTALALRKTRESMTNSTVLFLDRLIIGKDPEVRHYPSFHRFEYRNGSILAYGGMKNEDQREQIRSIGQDGSVDIAWMEEGIKFTEDDFQELLGRMRGKAAPWRQIIVTSNPDAPSHWIHKRLIIGGKAIVFYSSASDNPHNPEEYLGTLNELTGVLRQRLVEGKWVQAEGVVYDEYSEAVHLIDPFSIPDDWRRIRVIDFGYENPFVCQWWALDYDDRMYRYRELYITHRTVQELAPRIVTLSGQEIIEASVADHDAEDRATLDQGGIPTIAAIKSVSPGIQAVKQRLKPAGDGRPRLYFFKGALVEIDSRLELNHRPLCTEEEITLYSWARKREGVLPKDEPIKENDHGLDCTRYAVMYADRPIGDIGEHAGTRKPTTAGYRKKKW